jgi:Calpain family cysteine protease
VFNHADAVGTYARVKGSLFGPNGPQYLDVRQGGLGDCWLLASLAEVAARDPSDIRSMFTYDGTTSENGVVVQLYIVSFFDSSGKAEYVAVDTELPEGGNYYDCPVNGVLWVALAEKAYVQANRQGFVTTNYVGYDSYLALNGGDPSWAMQAITGKPAYDYNIDPANIAIAWNAGDLVVICTGNSTASPYILPDHCYAVVDYNPSSSVPLGPIPKSGDQERDVG